ncbi:unnamed protein product [Phytomonas sp. Hart1]|nr:unnamed protein product [Phytomonas sp. Hart1]|eukprot:CCW67750.1 unnamed protein product [Phytomonas sp. isolate Hart1]
MSFKDSKVSSLAAALTELHPLAVFEPDKVDALRDPTLLYNRISDYFSSAGVVLKESLDVFKHLDRLTQDYSRHEWVESKIKQYQTQLKYSAMHPKDATSILKDYLANPLPSVTDAEVDAFIKSLTPTQLKTLRRMHAIEKLDGFDYMWDLEEIHDASTCEKKSTINAHSTHGNSVVLPSVTHKSISRNADDRMLSGVSITPMDPPSTRFMTNEKSVIEYIPNTHTSNTTLIEPAYTVEAAYTIGDGVIESISDDESTGSFCRFSRIALARAEKQGLFQGDLEVNNLTKGEATVTMSPKEHLNAPILAQEPQRNGTDMPYCKEISSLLLSPEDLGNNSMGAVTQSDSRLSVEDGLNMQRCGSTPGRINLSTSSSFKEHVQNTHNSCGRGKGCDTDLLSEYVRNVLLLSKARERDELSLRRTIYKESEQEIAAVIAQCVPAMEQLLVLLKEVNSILPALNSLERSALSEHIEDPANFLLIPRHTLRCADFTCGAAFSTTVMRVRCGRCGQVFCPQCCQECGLGPDVCCGDQRVSLGWEPICSSCWRVCKEHQIIFHQKHLHQCLIKSSGHVDKCRVSSAVFSSIYEWSGNPDVLGHDTISSSQSSSRSTTDGAVKQSPVEFSIDKRLEDGFAAFYVVTGLSELMGLNDSWTYRVAKMRGSLQCLWQRTGILARKVITNAAHQLKQQRKHRIKQIILPMFQIKGYTTPVSLATGERVENNNKNTS